MVGIIAFLIFVLCIGLVVTQVIKANANRAVEEDVQPDEV